MRVKLVAKGTIGGLKGGSDIPVLLVPHDDDTPDRPDHIQIALAIDPEADPGDPELLLFVNSDG